MEAPSGTRSYSWTSGGMEGGEGSRTSDQAWHSDLPLVKQIPLLETNFPTETSAPSNTLSTGSTGSHTGDPGTWGQDLWFLGHPSAQETAGGSTWLAPRSPPEQSLPPSGQVSTRLPAELPRLHTRPPAHALGHLRAHSAGAKHRRG